jgi:hypothetical protein
VAGAGDAAAGMTMSRCAMIAYLCASSRSSPAGGRTPRAPALPVCGAAGPRGLRLPRLPSPAVRWPRAAFRGASCAQRAAARGSGRRRPRAAQRSGSWRRRTRRCPSGARSRARAAARRRRCRPAATRSRASMARSAVLRGTRRLAAAPSHRAAAGVPLRGGLGPAVRELGVRLGLQR